MTIKKLLIIFLSLILAVSCSSNVDPTAQNFTEENPGGGGHLNDFGNDDLIDNGDSSESAIANFINKYAGVYYENGLVTYKLKDGKLYENKSWAFTEITEGIIVDPSGNKMQISNRATSILNKEAGNGFSWNLTNTTGTIEVLNFKKDGNDKDGFSRYHLNILVQDKTKVEAMNKFATYNDLGKYKGTFYEINGEQKTPFLSIDDDGTVYFKESVRANHFGRDNGDLYIIDNYNTKYVIKFKEGNFVYRKYSRSGDDISVDSSSVTRDFVESLGETKYAGSSPSYGNITIEFNKFNGDGEIAPYPGGIKISHKFTDRVAKRTILKGKTLTVFDGGNGRKIDWTLTLNDDNSEATYVKDGETVTLAKQISE